MMNQVITKLEEHQYRPTHTVGSRSPTRWTSKPRRHRPLPPRPLTPSMDPIVVPTQIIVMSLREDTQDSKRR